MSDRLLTTRQVADYLGVSSETVLRRWRCGELPGFRLASNCLRFSEREIEAWLAARRLDGDQSASVRTASIAPRPVDVA